VKRRRRSISNAPSSPEPPPSVPGLALRVAVRARRERGREASPRARYRLVSESPTSSEIRHVTFWFKCWNLDKIFSFNFDADQSFRKAFPRALLLRQCPDRSSSLELWRSSFGESCRRRGFGTGASLGWMNPQQG
jgi:hypothetical protein